MFGILLGVGGLETGLLLEPGPGVVAPGAHGALDGALATVVDVPGGCDGVLPATVLEPAVELPVVELPLMDGVDPVVPLLVGVHGEATVFVVLPVVPPVTLPALPAVPGMPWVAPGVPVELAPGVVVVVAPGLCVLVVPGVVLVTPG